MTGSVPSWSSGSAKDSAVATLDFLPNLAGAFSLTASGSTSASSVSSTEACCASSNTVSGSVASAGAGVVRVLLLLSDFELALTSGTVSNSSSLDLVSVTASIGASVFTALRLTGFATGVSAGVFLVAIREPQLFLEVSAKLAYQAPDHHCQFGSLALQSLP